MIEVPFKINDWGILTMGVMWTQLYCPYCKKFRSDSFLFKFEMDKTEYIGKCQKCGKEIRILINKEENNALVKLVEERYRNAIAGDNTPLTKFVN